MSCFYSIFYRLDPSLSFSELCTDISKALLHQIEHSTFNGSIILTSIPSNFSIRIQHDLDKCFSFSHISICIHQAFIQQAMLYPNKSAVILDDQSLTYSELLSQVQQLSLILINEKGVEPGDNVCQCIDRSIEMIMGILSIMMAGAIYIPLNPTDPFERRQQLVDQVKAKLILDNKSVQSSLNGDRDIEQLSHVNVTPESISHIVFTSGSTGVPKGVQIRHRNFIAYMKTHVMQVNDITLQMTSSSFDSHLDDILGSAIRGAQLVLLKPSGHLDIDYTTKTIHDKNVTYVGPVPSWLNALGKYLHENSHTQTRISSLQRCSLGGEALLSSTINQILPFVSEQCQFFNQYGPAEITIVATSHEVNREELLSTMTIPIGNPLPGYCVYLLDEYQQSVVPGEVGEVFIGGVGVFAGYYGRDDLTSKVLIKINNELCYATGDLARLDNKSGELIFIGRRDFQIKLRGQRIEINEIEEVVLKESSLVTACVVMKLVHNEDEHLVCFVEGPLDGIKEDDLRDRCCSILPSYMVPSKFVVMERFPLTINGKIDRKALPSPDLSIIRDDEIVPRTDLENRVYKLWCRVLSLENIPINKSFFSLYGSSLQFMKLYTYYQKEFVCVPDILSCLQHATIIEHAQLLSECMQSTSNRSYQPWLSLQIDQAITSFAQDRIVVDEQIRMQRLSEKHMSVYNCPMVFRVSQNCVSIKRLREALEQITLKHAILRTSVQLDNMTQSIHLQDRFTFSVSLIENNSIETILLDENSNKTYFNLEQGQVFRCHLVQHCASDDFLFTGDWIIFNFHHAAFDGESERIFLNELQQFYRNKEKNHQALMLQYIDYSVHEREMNMTSSIMYWRQILSNYHFEKPMNLPFDRKPHDNDLLRTGQGFSIQIHFPSSVTTQLIEYASKLNSTLYQVCLTIYYIFLFKLTGGQRDLIVGIVNANRYRPELEDIIGMFVNTLPIGIHIDPQDTFDEVLSKVSNFLHASYSHFHVPYQIIIEQIPIQQRSRFNSIQTMFTLDELSIKPLPLDDNTFIQPFSIEDSNTKSSMFDITLSLEHTIETDLLQAEFIVSADLFHSSTLTNIANQFQFLVEQLVLMKQQSICELSLILPENRFWHEMMHEYDWNRHLTEKHIANDYTHCFQLTDPIVKACIDYATLTNISLPDLFLTCYYLFLFKLKSNDTDLCIFASNIPHRFQLQPKANFTHNAYRVAKLSQLCFKYSHFQQFTLPIYYDFSLIMTHDEVLNEISCKFIGSKQIHIFAQRFEILCNQLFASSFDLQTQPIYELSILLPNEQILLQQLNNNVHPSNVSICIHQAFIQQAMLYPNKSAVILDDQSLTYSELLSQVQQLSLILINEKGVEPGDNVCQCIDRSIEMIMGILSIMMAGAIYIPLNPTDPFERRQQLVDQVKAKLILDNKSVQSSLNGDRDIEQLSHVNVTPESISHIVFTSGSTGVPKGVQIRHRNFIAYMKTHVMQVNDITLQMTSSSFDSHLDDILGSAIRGAQLVLLKPSGHLDIDYTTKTIHDKNVTYVGPVPSWLNALGKYLHENSHTQTRISSLQRCSLGGEALLSSTINQILPFVSEQCQFFNQYGPAEITIVATSHEVNREELLSTMTIPIGNPLPGYCVYLLDEYQQSVVPGEVGEVFIGGVGVFAGYYGRDDLTSKVLIKINNELCYATGDLARLDNKSGELIFIGRRDFQIKLRGQRIELSTIEMAIIESSTDVLNCIVMKENIDNDDHLVAYVQIKNIVDDCQLQEMLFNQCKCRLPTYMIPNKWIFALELPLNVNGKIDRKKLKEIKGIGVGYKKVIMSSLELKLQDIFMRAFCLSSLPDIETSFSLLGGTSLGAMRALNLIRQEITENMDIGVLFANPSVAALGVALTPMITRTDLNDDDEEEEEDFSIRLHPSWLIESIGILVLVWQWLWPILLVIKLQFSFLSMLLVPLIHLIQFPLFIELFGRPFERERNRLYTWQYYRIWFLKRQWSLNTYWLGYLLGTRFYNKYLCLCGARINDNAYIYTTHIDAPWLVKVDDSTYIGDEVVLSSMTYHEHTYELHEIIIGSHCSIGTRSVLHDGVNISDNVAIEPLTNVTGHMNSKYQLQSPLTKLNFYQSSFQLMSMFVMITIHIVIIKLILILTNFTYLYIQLSIGWLIWIILSCVIALLLLLCIGHVEQNFCYPLNSWQFLLQFWLRKLIVSSCGPCLSSVFNEGNRYTPSILKWLGVTIQNKDILIIEIVPLLLVPPNLLVIDSGSTITSSVCFVPYDVTIECECIVVGPIHIGRGSFIGNYSVIRSGASILEDMVIGSLTRVDSTTTVNGNKGDILFGIPAHPMPIGLSNANVTTTTTTGSPQMKQILIYEFINALIFSLCVTVSNLNLFLFIYSSIICIAYRQWPDFSICLLNYYEKWFGCLLGGTQWLVIILRCFGVNIGDNVIIEDMKCIDDMHLTTIGSYSRLSSTCRIQCHTFEQRSMKYRSVILGPHCILQPMSLILPGVRMIGHNRLMPCSVVLPHDQLSEHTDWLGSPVKKLIVHHNFELPQLILAECQSCVSTYDIVVGRYGDDVLTLYFRDNEQLLWQTRMNLRRPFRPFDISTKLFFTGFLCKQDVNRVLIFGLGGGILPMLIRHYFPFVVIDIVENDQTVIEFATNYFGFAEHKAITDRYTTTNKYDIIFIVNAFNEITANIRNILNDNGCLVTNGDQALSLKFQSNISLVYKNNKKENTHVMICGDMHLTERIGLKEKAINEAKQLEISAHLEFSLAKLLSFSYQS